MEREVFGGDTLGKRAQKPREEITLETIFNPFIERLSGKVRYLLELILDKENWSKSREHRELLDPL